MLQDPLRIDRELRAVARSHRSFRAALRAGRGEDHAFEHIGSRISHELLQELADAANDPLAPALLRSAHRLHEAHALAGLEREHAVALRLERHPLDAPERGHFTLSELLAAVLADKKGQREAYVEALTSRAGHASDLVLRRTERHVELRAALASFIPASIDLPGDAVLEVATELRASSGEAWRALAPQTLAEVIELGVGRDSRASWPARLTARSIAELFADAPWLAHGLPEPFGVPVALGAASFLRGLFGFGAALRVAFTSNSQPFVIASDPYGLERATFGALFALLPMSDSFARRQLGVPRQAANDHRRALAHVLLVTLRESLVRVSLRAPALAGASELGHSYTELAFDALGIELPAQLLGTLFTPRPADAQRLAGLLLAVDLTHRLSESHDEDWYRNPRAIEEVREEARAPAATNAGADELKRGAKRLVSWLDESL